MEERLFKVRHIPTGLYYNSKGRNNLSDKEILYDRSNGDISRRDRVKVNITSSRSNNWVIEKLKTHCLYMLIRYGEWMFTVPVTYFEKIYIDNTKEQ